MVFVHHVPPARALAERLSFGYAGVGFFFVLSGFILTYAHHRDFAGPLRAHAVRAFVVARIARIYPVHLAATALALAWFVPFGAPQWNVSSVHDRIAGFLAQVFLVQSWSANANVYGGGNPVSWSISVEALFYAAFPFGLWLLLRATRRAHARTLVVLAAAICAAEYALLWTVHVTPGVTWLLYRFPLARLPDFALGALLGLAFVRRTAPAAPRRGGTALEIVAVLAVAVAIVILPFLPETLRYAAGLMPFWALLIVVFARESGALSRALSHPWPVRLGEISFAFYMLHWLVLDATTDLLGWNDPALSLAVAFTLSLAASFGAFHRLERPMRRAVLSRFARAHQRRGTSVERAAGIEPATLAWKARALPLCNARARSE